MALPDKRLDLDIDPEKATLDDVALLANDFDNDLDFANAVRKFLLAHTNWTRQDVRGITVNELGDVVNLIGDAFIDQSLGEASAPDSETGQPATPGESSTTETEAGGEATGGQRGKTSDG